MNFIFTENMRDGKNSEEKLMLHRSTWRNLVPTRNFEILPEKPENVLTAQLCCSNTMDITDKIVTLSTAEEKSGRIFPCWIQ